MVSSETSITPVMVIRVVESLEKGQDRWEMSKTLVISLIVVKILVAMVG